MPIGITTREDTTVNEETDTKLRRDWPLTTWRRLVVVILSAALDEAQVARVKDLIPRIITSKCFRLVRQGITRYPSNVVLLGSMIRR